MTLKLYCIGKLKEDYLKKGVKEYVKRLNAYLNVQIIEVDDEKLSSYPNDSEITLAKNKEGQRVLKLLKNNEYLIGLDLVNKQPNSEQFAHYLEDKFVLSGASLSFVIGGSYGLSDELKKRCNDRIALSMLTFPHQLTRLIFLEQVYRAFKINHHEVYHK